MERKRALKIATAVAGPALAVWAGVGCSGENNKSNPLPFLTDSTASNTNSTPLNSEDQSSVSSLTLPESTPTAQIAPAEEVENIEIQEAVVDMGNFDMAIVGWEEYRVEPLQTRVFNGQTGDSGTVVDIKHVVVKAIMRNKSDQFQDLTELGAEATGIYGVQFVDLSGNKFNSGQEVVVPIEYKGVFDDPYEQSEDGTMRSLRELSSRMNPKPSTLMPPGFGLPVFFVGQMPVDTEDYGVDLLYQPLAGSSVEKFVKRGEVAKDFSLIASDVKIYNSDDSLVGNFAEPSYEIKLLGSSKASPAPGVKLQNVLLLDVKNNSNNDVYPLSYSEGKLYLKEGRVVSIGNSQEPVLPHRESIYGLVIGTENPKVDFPNYSSQLLDENFDFDLKDAVVLLSTDGGWKAWKMPDTLSNPVGAGGE